MPQEKDIAMSIEQYENFIQSDPENHLIWLKLGDLYHRAARFDDALASFEQCARFSADDAVCRSRQASVLISQHRFADAETTLRQLIDDGENTPELQHNLGLALFYQRRWPEAQACFEQARDAGLDAAGNLDYLARSLHQQSQWDAAIKACENWYASTGDANAQGYLALLHMDRGHLHEAEPLAEQVLQKQPDNADAAAVIGTASIERQDMDRAAELFNRMVERQPNNPRGWLGRGLVQLYRQDPKAGIRDLQKASSLMPGNAGTVVALGWAHIANNDVVQAEAGFRQAVEIDHNFAEAQGGLAAALVFQGKLDEAKELIKIARRLNPANFGGNFALSLERKLRGHEKRATDIVAGLLQQEPVPGAKPLIEHIQVFMAKQGATGDDHQNDSQSE